MTRLSLGATRVSRAAARSMHPTRVFPLRAVLPSERPPLLPSYPHHHYLGQTSAARLIHSNGCTRVIVPVVFTPGRSIHPLPLCHLYPLHLSAFHRLRYRRRRCARTQVSSKLGGNYGRSSLPPPNASKSRRFALGCGAVLTGSGNLPRKVDGTPPTLIRTPKSILVLDLEMR